MEMKGIISLISF